MRVVEKDFLRELGGVVASQNAPLRQLGRLWRLSSGTTDDAVWLWRERWKKKGEKGLAPRPTPGRPRRLTERQRQRLPKILAVGAQLYGFPNDLWTARRIAAVIEREFGIRYHPAHVTRLLAQLNWSYQKPERRALERKEGAIEHWKRYRWVEIKKKSAG